MSDEYTPLDEGDGIKNLRKQYEQTQKELAEARKLLGDFQKAERTKTVAEVLKAKGLDEPKAKKAAALYGGEDASEDAVGKWLEDFADVFGVSNSNDANAQNAQRVSDAAGGSVDGLPSVRTGEPIMGNPEEIANAISTLPYDELVKLGYMPPRGTIFNPNR